MIQYSDDRSEVSKYLIVEINLDELDSVNGGIGAILRVAAKVAGYVASGTAGAVVGTTFTKAVEELKELMDG